MEDIIFQNKNLLITSVSAKVPLIDAVFEQLKNSGIKIILADNNKNCLASNLDFDFWQMPLLKDLSAENLIDFCKSKNIKFILPTRNGELLYFSEIKNKLKENGIYTMVADKEPLEKALDKLYYYKEVSKHNINVIKTSENINDLGDVEKFVVKEKRGAGSINLKLNCTKEEAEIFAKNLDEPIFQPYIEGEEYSADCYFDIEKNFLKTLIRKRILVKSGEAQITECVQDKEAEKEIINLLRTLRLSGHSVSQFLKTKDKKIFIIETNPRIGGATPLAFKCGLLSIKWFIYSSLGYEISNNSNFMNLKMVRVPKDLFYDTNF